MDVVQDFLDRPDSPGLLHVHQGLVALGTADGEELDQAFSVQQTLVLGQTPHLTHHTHKVINGSQVLAIVFKKRTQKGPSKPTQGPFVCYYMEDVFMPLTDLVN